MNIVQVQANILHFRLYDLTFIRWNVVYLMIIKINYLKANTFTLTLPHLEWWLRNGYSPMSSGGARSKPSYQPPLPRCSSGC